MTPVILPLLLWCLLILLLRWNSASLTSTALFYERLLHQQAARIVLVVHSLPVCCFEVIWWLSNEVSTGYSKNTWLFFLVISKQCCWLKIQPPGGPARKSAVVIEVYQTFSHLICAGTVIKWSETVHHAVYFIRWMIICLCPVSCGVTVQASHQWTLSVTPKEVYAFCVR